MIVGVLVEAERNLKSVVEGKVYMIEYIGNTKEEISSLM